MIKKPLDLLLIQHSSGFWEKAISGYYLPLSLITAAREIPREYNIKLVDVRISGKKVLDQYSNQDDLLVGFSLLTGRSIRNALEIIRYLRATNPSVKVLVGGVHPTILPEQTLQSSAIDYIIVGYGEAPLKEMLAARRSGEPDFSEIKGLGFKRNADIFVNPPRPINQEELDNYNFPRYDLLDMKHYIINYDNRLSIYSETSRGCNFRCSFCSNAALRNHWIPYSPEYVVRHIEYLRHRYGVSSFVFVDSDFFYDLERVRKICELLIQKKLAITWTAQGTRVQEMLQMNDEFIRTLRESGLWEFESVGVESGSQRIVDMMGKGFLVEEIPHINRKLAETGIPVRYNFLIGSPGEEYNDVRKTIDVALRINAENPFASNSMFYIYAPYPGTDFFAKAITLGFEPPKSFEEWARLRVWGWESAAAPWRSQEERTRLEKVCFLSIFTTLRYWERFFRRLPILKIFFILYRRVAIFRLRRAFFSFMPEFLLWKWIRKILNR